MRPGGSESGMVMRVTRPVIEAIRNFVGEHPAERGGMLGRDPDRVVRHFVADRTGRCSRGAYDPDIDTLNGIIKTEWKPADIEFCGFSHSHPRRVRHPSSHDTWYCGEILKSFKRLEVLWTLIVMTRPDTGRIELLPFAALPGAGDRGTVVISPALIEIV